MRRYYIFKDGTQIGSTETRDEAVDMIRRRQKRETHYLLRSEFSIIYGCEEFIHYEKAHEKGAFDCA
ncbi:hypothetical protein [Intestinimonas butyriciproducens]|uniref:hypothetical protein n=1 Tax=Intestinimonas butyriciproducens TaxID=1297617 RepID=UPI00195A888F|nr:hypothetical protein [Intestinimonas butyriciproducens]MBM6977296.1 hypothetical protein [Intestinimonas butyriciproducens]